MDLIDERSGKDIDVLPILNDKQLYVYILQNTAGKVKVGVSHNLSQRIQSLSGSNGQGNTITHCYCSPATYLTTIEGIMHNRMKQCRIEGTEWFYYEDDPSGDILFDSAIELMEKLFSSTEYARCNELRKNYSSKI